MRALAGLLLALAWSAPSLAAGDEPPAAPTPAPEALPATHEDGYRDGAAEARTKPLWDWMLIGGGASLMTSGMGVPCVPPAPFLTDFPECPSRGADASRGEAYVRGYEKGYDQTLRSRRAVAGTISAVVVASALAIGYAIAVEARYGGEGGEDASLVRPELFRF